MHLLQSLIHALPEQDIPVRGILVGIHWTVVRSAGCGISASLRNERPHHHHMIRDAGHLHKKSAQELASLVFSDNLIEASIGMAALNSCISVDEASLTEGNALKILRREGMGKNIAMVGHFSFATQLASLARNVWIIEKEPQAGDLPEEAAGEVLPHAELVVITATALVNHSIERLLPLCSPSARIMLLGPSAPLSPILLTHGIQMVSGVQVIDERETLQSIEQGAILPQVKGIRLVTLE